MHKEDKTGGLCGATHIGLAPYGRKTHAGFTIVELLIVIVVIAVLAAISVVAYTGIQNGAHESAADSLLTQVGRKLAMHKAEHEAYPNSLEDIDVESEGNIALDYFASGNGYCLSAATANIVRSISAASQAPTTGSCDAALSKWTFPGGHSSITFDGTSNQIRFHPSLPSAAAHSPLIANDGRRFARISAEVFVTQPAPDKTPYSSVIFGSRYFASDKVTSATNTTGHTGNGNASCNVSMSTWTTCTWTPLTGPNVQWVSFQITANSNSYTSDNIIRNIQVTVHD